MITPLIFPLMGGAADCAYREAVINSKMIKKINDFNLSRQ